jgi:serine/threonine protein kinase
VHVIDFGRDEVGRWFIALERLRGEDLGDALSRGALASELVVEIGHQLLSALAATHGQGVIHRDVKPENIFLARDDSDALRVKLLDFGIAKAIGGKNVEPMIHTLEGMKLGTPHYMSPEQWAGHDLSARSDVWAAGAVLYTATMGEPPFDADDVGALAEKVRKTAPPSLRALRPDLGPAFVDTIDRALATEPIKRFSDCRAMAAALHTGGVRVEELDW